MDGVALEICTWCFHEAAPRFSINAFKTGGLATLVQSLSEFSTDNTKPLLLPAGQLPRILHTCNALLFR
jgi:hypothetical protein